MQWGTGHTHSRDVRERVTILRGEGCGNRHGMKKIHASLRAGFGHDGLGGHTPVQDVLEDHLLAIAVEGGNPNEKLEETDPDGPPVNLGPWDVCHVIGIC